MQLTIKQRMGMTVGVTLLGMVVIIVFMVVGFTKVHRQQELMDRLTLINNTALRGNIAMLKAREYEAEFFDRKQDKWVPRVKQAVDQVNKELDVILKNTDDPKIKGWAESARKLATQYVQQFQELASVALGSNFQGAELAETREELRDILNEFEPLLDNYIPKQVGVAYQAATEEMDRSIAAIRLQIFGAVLLVAVAMLVSISSTAIYLLRSLRLINDRLRDIADGDGDLTKRIELQSRDELGTLAVSFNNFVGKLHDIIAQVSQGTLQVASASYELQANAEQMAHGAEAAATQVNTVASSSEVLAASTFEISSNCGTVAESSRRANDSAQTGAVVVEKTVDIMARIAERVKDSARTVESLGARGNQIGEIISTIEDIADQTNLLALNAAIEAARAGEQGRGFAVVADEVRALAERTARATREITAVIRSIQQETQGAVTAMTAGVVEVERGTAEASRSGEALRGILERIHAVEEQVVQIAAAADQQTATTTEISGNILRISDVVQSTTRGAQDSADAAAHLQGLAEELHAAVGRFRVAG
ncbi:MAG TPA: methyl-accepting chemotaxis protein [Geobacter sulfurreducens]|nr:methyl-accepting chemotaxis protein [Geobacter sulfurreducens]